MFTRLIDAKKILSFGLAENETEKEQNKNDSDIEHAI